MTQESWFQRLWRLITPELIYIAICYIVDLAAAAYLRFSMGGEYSSGNFEKFLTVVLSDKLIQYAVLLQTVAAFFSILILLRCILKTTEKTFCF